MILITGASGFVGQHLINALVERFSPSSVRILDARPPSFALPSGVQATCGLIENPQSVATALHGVEVVVHLAAKVQPDSRDIQEMRRVNVDGTRSVYSAAAHAGCKLFVHMSSAGIYGPPRSPSRFKEGDVPAPVTPYQRTKWEAEEVLRNADSKGTTLNILRPAGLYGPGSRLEIPSYKQVLSKRWTIEFTGGVVVHPTHVTDIVKAIVALVQQPAPHATVFNVGGERPVRVDDLHALTAEILGVRRRRVVLPPWIATPLIGIATPGLALMGRRNPLLARISRGGLLSSAVDDSLFRDRYPTVPVVALALGVREHIDWARAHSLL